MSYKHAYQVAKPTLPRTPSSINKINRLPSIELMKGFPEVEKVNIHDYCKGKKTILVGLPGAFTPTCSGRQVPGYLENQDKLKEAGINEVIVYCVNDPAVMQAWSKCQKIEGSMITFLADPAAEFTKAVDLQINHPGPEAKGIIGRCKRSALYIVDGVIEKRVVSEGPDDPTGDNDPSASLAEAMLKTISIF